MAFKRVLDVGHVMDESHIEMPKGTVTAFAIGDVLSWDRSENYLIRATSSTDNHGSDCYAGVCQSVQVSGDTTCRMLFLQPGQVFEADTNAATAAAQIGHRYHLTDHDTLDNDGTDGTSAKDIFEVIKQIGATTDNKVLVRIIGPAGQVTA